LGGGNLEEKDLTKLFCHPDRSHEPEVLRMVYGEVEGSLFKTEEIPPLREYASVGMTSRS